MGVQSPQQQLIIMQGASGSGKSTLARKIAREEFGGTVAEGGLAFIFSTDEFFYATNPDDPTGSKTYQWAFPLLSRYHARNQERTRKALVEGYTVIVDNTNLTREVCTPYVEMAVARNIPVRFVSCTGQYQNTHDVPTDKVEAMRKNIETLTVESVLAVRPTVRDINPDFSAKIK